MLKVRVSFSDEIEKDEFIKMLQKETEVLSVSEEYKNRNSKFKRIYVELDKKEL